MVLTTEPIPSVATNWDARLESAFQGLFVQETPSRGSDTVTQAHSRDEHTFWETASHSGVLRQARLRLVMPRQDELEIIRLGCWTILFLKAIFPGWREMERWIQECGSRVARRHPPTPAQLNGYKVTCQSIPGTRLLEYQVVQAS